jgi:hypothetical protein
MAISGTDWLEVPTIYKAYFLGLCKGIFPPNMALYGTVPPSVGSWNSHDFFPHFSGSFHHFPCAFFDDLAGRREPWEAQCGSWTIGWWIGICLTINIWIILCIHIYYIYVYIYVYIYTYHMIIIIII